MLVWYPTPSKLPKKEYDRNDYRIVARLYDKLADLGYSMEGFAAVRKRVKELIQETGDPHQVALVCSLLCDKAGEQFSPATIAYTSFDYVRRTLNVPEGAWPYEDWSYCQPLGSSLQLSADYWLGLWRDSDEDSVKDLARSMLERLYYVNDVTLEEVSI